jgi:hypothetical protein
MVDKEDVELVRTGYSAFVAGDMEWLNEHRHVKAVSGRALCGVPRYLAHHADTPFGPTVRPTERSMVLFGQQFGEGPVNYFPEPKILAAKPQVRPG